MFGKMREALGITKSVDILDHIRSLPINEQLIANQAIENVERTAMVQMVAQPGLSELMTYLTSRGVPKGICTRNFEAPVDHLLKTFLSGVDISPVVTRVFTPPKPHPAGILHIAKAWGVPVEDMACVLMVGDSIDDMSAGRRAGATTVLLRNTVNTELVGDSSTDCVIDRYAFLFLPQVKVDTYNPGQT